MIQTVKTKKVTNPRFFGSAIVLLVLACVPTLASARYRTRSYRYGYPRRYFNNHWDDWGGYSNSCRYGFCGRRRAYNPVIDLFGELVDASMNSLARQQRRQIRNQQLQRRLPVKESQTKRPLQYHFEDYGREGVELSMKLPGLKAHEMDLGISLNENGARILSVRGTPGVHRRRMGENPKYSQSFLIKDDTIDMDGIDARVSSSGILTVSMPRKTTKRTRIVPSSVLESKRRVGEENSLEGSLEEEKVQPLAVEEPSQKNEIIIQEEVDIDDEEDGLWISEEEDIW